MSAKSSINNDISYLDLKSKADLVTVYWENLYNLYANKTVTSNRIKTLTIATATQKKNYSSHLVNYKTTH